MNFPERIEVILTDSKETQRLKQQVEDLTAKLEDVQSRYNRLSYQLRCELMINTQLTDWLHAQKIQFPRRLIMAKPIETSGD